MGDEKAGLVRKKGNAFEISMQFSKAPVLGATLQTVFTPLWLNKSRTKLYAFAPLFAGFRNITIASGTSKTV